jgi:hypothetical protein
MKKIVVLFLLLCILFLPGQVNGEMVSPDNTYLIYADVVDTGGVLSAGGIYSLEDTIGEPIATSTSGGAYSIRGGYQAMTSSTISISISDAAIALGDLSVDAVKSDSALVTVTTDDETGYTLSIASADWVGGSLADVGLDHSVDIGTEEYGLAASGVDSQLVGDWSVTAGRTISTSSTPVTNSVTTLTFKAAISALTVSGVYNQSVVLQAVANFNL